MPHWFTLSIGGLMGLLIGFLIGAYAAEGATLTLVPLFGIGGTVVGALALDWLVASFSRRRRRRWNRLYHRRTGRKP
jgi:hypothetical protein